MKSKVGRLIFLMVVLIAGFSVLRSESKKDEPVDLAMLQRAADKTNQSLPVELVSGVRTEKTTVGPDLQWNFSYTFLEQVNSPETSQLAQNLAAPLKSQFCNSPQFSILLEDNVALELRFTDSLGQHVWTERLTGKICGLTV